MLKNKTVFITGASSGIGEACANQFAALGARLIITGRRLDRLQKLAKKLNETEKVEILPLRLDVRNKEEVKKNIAELPDNWKNIDILINNAGLALSTTSIQEGSLEDWDTMIDTNVKGLLYLTRAILPGMIAQSAGHIINISSVAGHDYYAGGNIYCATKHAVKAISHCLRIDLSGTPIRVSEIAPGAVQTEFSEVRWKDKARSDAFYSDFTPLTADDVARSIVFCAIQPAHVNVSEIMIFPTDQGSTSLISRKSKTEKKGIFD
jgi:3-hydroxy acid dehydrogenase/malonic semialdehyde reductase